MKKTYQKFVSNLRLPLEGSIDLTYRCNNHCLHCWLWVPDQDSVQKNELTYEEIRNIVDDARAMGCQYWRISGGEPLLRPDFPEIFNYLTSKAIGYTLNTNGTLITPEIAKLLKRKGTKMIALYGATSKVYDHISGHNGGFEKLMQGFAYMKEAGASFIVQLIPMQANWHQWDEMKALAKSLSPFWRVGAPWLYLSSNRSTSRNQEIKAQRLFPWQVTIIDPPKAYFNNNTEVITLEVDSNSDLTSKKGSEKAITSKPVCADFADEDYHLFARCIENRENFHIDPYGQITWCSFIKDPHLRYNLRTGSFQEAWENFIPSIAEKIHGGQEWTEHCGTCEKRSDCRWCAVHSYIESGRYSAPVSYLCSLADERIKFKNNWREKHRRFFQIAGITVCLESDVSFETTKLTDKLKVFSVDDPGTDIITLRHHFEIPDLKVLDLGQELYRKEPWVISYKDGTWYYRIIVVSDQGERLNKLAVFSDDYTNGIIFSSQQSKSSIIKHGWQSLSLLPTDQIWLGPLLANRSAMLFHSSAAIVNDRGLIFMGHAEAGKTTTIELLKAAGLRGNGLKYEVLCDDRNIIRKWSNGWRVHGTWSHGAITDVSSSSAALKGIFFLEQSKENLIIRLDHRKEILKKLLSTLIRTMVTAKWWHKELDLIEQIISEVPCYRMCFDKSGAIIPELEKLTRESNISA